MLRIEEVIETSHSLNFKPCTFKTTGLLKGCFYDAGGLFLEGVGRRVLKYMLIPFEVLLELLND